MIQLVQKRKRGGNGSITFPNLQCWNPETKVVTFIAEIDGERIDCKIKVSELNKYPEFSNDPLISIRLNKISLESIARLKIENGKFNKNGSIQINHSDLK